MIVFVSSCSMSQEKTIHYGENEYPLNLANDLLNSMQIADGQESSAFMAKVIGHLGAFPLKKELNQETFFAKASFRLNSFIIGVVRPGDDPLNGNWEIIAPFLLGEIVEMTIQEIIDEVHRLL